MSTKRPSDSCGQPESKRCKDNDASIRFSRACPICLTDSPRFRAVLTPCGHIFCRGCALKLKWNAAARYCDLLVICPCCRCEGKYRALEEDLVEGNHQETYSSSEKRSDETLVRVDDKLNETSSESNHTRVREDADEKRLTVEDEDKLINDALDTYEPCMAACLAATAALRASSAASKVVFELQKAEPYVMQDEAGQFETRKAVDEYRTAECSAVRVTARATAARLNALLAALPDLGVRGVQTLERIRAARKKSTAARAAAKLASAKFEAINADRDEKHIRVDRKISDFEKENEICAALGHRFSRACRACDEEEPHRRSIFPTCGHAVCRECADAHASDADVKCPVCRTEGSCVKLFEEVIED